MRKFIMIIGIAVILFSISNAEVPHLISYQGILKDSTGEVVEDNVYALKFSIYNDSTEGLLLWESEGYVPNQIINGLFQHVLGSTNPIPDSISRSVPVLSLDKSPVDFENQLNCINNVSVQAG